MSKTTTPKPADKKAEEIQDTSNKKVCFVVMPISDQEGYEKDHFDRVYKHLIAPAIKDAGLEPKRADEEQVTNDIRLDIIKKILESDHVICDLSARNPNVFYELGMRQAFDKSITLIKDNKTPRVFDVAGIRTIDYDENLRIDNIGPKVTEIANSIRKTLEHLEASPYENSIIRQLGITAAQPAEKTEISPDTQLILEQIKYLSNRVSDIDTKGSNLQYISNNSDGEDKVFSSNGDVYEVGRFLNMDKQFMGKIDYINIKKNILVTVNGNVKRRYKLDTVLNSDRFEVNEVPF